MKLTYICKICGKESINNNGLISHITQTHKLTSKDYYDKFFKKENEEICPVCGKLNKFIKFSKGYHKTCSIVCGAKLSSSKSRETRYKNNGEGHWLSKSNVENLSKIASETFERRNKENIEKLKKEYNIPDEIKITSISQIQQIKDKKEQTALKKYGVKNTFLVKDNNGNEKREKTYLELYGYDHPTMVKYKYKNQYFDSSWELAYYIWLTDNHINFEYHPQPIPYYWSGDNKTHNYYPDFKLNNKDYVEIKRPDLYENMKNNIGSKENAKYNKMIGLNVKIYTDCKKFLTFVENHYGKDYLKLFKLKNKNSP